MAVAPGAGPAADAEVVELAEAQAVERVAEVEVAPEAVLGAQAAAAAAGEARVGQVEREAGAEPEAQAVRAEGPEVARVVEPAERAGTTVTTTRITIRITNRGRLFRNFHHQLRRISRSWLRSRMGPADSRYSTRMICLGD